jgi:hypothetical protein
MHMNNYCLFSQSVANTQPALPSMDLKFEKRLEWVMEYPWNAGPSDELDEAWYELTYG